jgi:hypothetical protein
MPAFEVGLIPIDFIYFYVFIIGRFQFRNSRGRQSGSIRALAKWSGKLYLSRSRATSSAFNSDER